jgi:hypothetical protein
VKFLDKTSVLIIQKKLIDSFYYETGDIAKIAATYAYHLYGLKRIE